MPVFILRFATIKKEILNSYRLEVICTTCCCRGELWFNKDYKILSHACPKCNKKTLRSPTWLNRRKKTTIFIANKF